ncbi:MAG: PAS domain-containing protein, partial [Desulfovermiculus sp.]
LKGRIIEANAAMTRQTGHNREELLGMDYAHTCIPAEANQVEQRMTRIRETGSSTFESMQSVKTDQSSRWRSAPTALNSTAAQQCFFSAGISPSARQLKLK